MKDATFGGVVPSYNTILSFAIAKDHDEDQQPTDVVHKFGRGKEPVHAPRNTENGSDLLESFLHDYLLREGLKDQ